jgi:small-conductance mechanosensitive channel
MPETETISRGLAIGLGLLIMAVAWVVAALIRYLLRRLTRRAISDSHAVGVVVSAPYYLVILIGVLLGLDAMGVKIAPVLTGLGLGGFILGIALRDVLSNFISGVMMLFYKPFERGDTITVVGYSGKVEEVNLRYTTIRGQEEIYLIPNATLLSSPIKLVERREPPRT